MQQQPVFCENCEKTIANLFRFVTLLLMLLLVAVQCILSAPRLDLPNEISLLSQRLFVCLFAFLVHFTLHSAAN